MCLKSTYVKDNFYYTKYEQKLLSPFIIEELDFVIVYHGECRPVQLIFLSVC